MDFFHDLRPTVQTPSVRVFLGREFTDFFDTESTRNNKTFSSMVLHVDATASVVCHWTVKSESSFCKVVLGLGTPLRAAVSGSNARRLGRIAVGLSRFCQIIVTSSSEPGGNAAPSVE